MISKLHVKTIIGAASAYAGISFGSISLDVRLQPGRSAAASLRQWSLDELKQANRRIHRAMIAITAAKALDATCAGATHAVDEDASVESAADLLDRLAGFASTYASASAMDSGGQALVDKARSMAMLLRGDPVYADEAQAVSS